MNKNLTNLLENCTVRIEVGSNFGTGFFVAPGVILTCAHVVKPDKIKNQPVKVIYKKKAYKPERISKKDVFVDEYPDLAILKVDITDHPCVYLDDDIQVWDKFYSYGYTADQIKGEGVTVECEGIYDEDHQLIKVKMGQIQYGFSGSPLLNSRTERVSGMLQMSRDPDKERGGFAFPVESVNKFFPGLLDRNRKFHDDNSQWEKAFKQPIKRSAVTVPVIYVKPGTVVEPGKQLFGHSLIFDRVFNFLRNRKRVLLTGMTGIGKTFLAENITEKWLQEETKPVAWLKVGYQDQETLQDSFMEILAKMGVDRSQYDKARGENKRLVLHSIFDESAIDLLVLDDVRNMDALTFALRAIPVNISVLITSRQLFDIDEIVDIDDERLQLSDALALLGHYAGGKSFNNNSAAEQLCKDFAFHPLALELCGSIMRRQRLMPQELLQKPNRGSLNLSKPGRIGLRDLLEDSFDDLDQQSRLVFTGFGSFYENGVTSAYLGKYLGMTVDVLGKALDDLFNYNLINRRQGTEFYSMHDLVFAYSQTLAKKDSHASKNLIDATLEYLELYKDNYELLSLDMPNLLFVADQCGPVKLVEIMSWLTIGGYPAPGADSYFENKGHSQDFLRRLDQAIEMYKNVNGRHQEIIHYLLGKRGDAYFNLGLYDQALTKYERAIAFAPDKSRQAIVTSVAARTYFRKGERLKAKEYFNESYEIARQLNDNLLLLSIMGQECLAASYSNSFTKIRNITKKQVVIAKRIVETKPSTQAYRQLFFALLNLGTAELELSKRKKSTYETALSFLQQAQAIAEKQESDVLRAYVLDSLAENYHYLDQRLVAQETFERALMFWEKLGMHDFFDDLNKRMHTLGYSISDGITSS